MIYELMDAFKLFQSGIVVNCVPKYDAWIQATCKLIGVDVAPPEAELEELSKLGSVMLVKSETGLTTDEIDHCDILVTGAEWSCTWPNQAICISHSKTAAVWVTAKAFKKVETAMEQALARLKRP